QGTKLLVRGHDARARALRHSRDRALTHRTDDNLHRVHRHLPSDARPESNVPREGPARPGAVHDFAYIGPASSAAKWRPVVLMIAARKLVTWLGNITRLYPQRLSAGASPITERRVALIGNSASCSTPRYGPCRDEHR